MNNSNKVIAEEDRCVLCNSVDRDLKSDHLRECYKSNQDQLSRDMFRPPLSCDEMGTLKGGFNYVCSNRLACRKRQKENARKA